MPRLLEILEELKKEHGSINAAARAVGMPQATFWKLYKGEEHPRLDTLRALAKYRRQPLWKLIREIDNNGSRAGQRT